MKDGVSVRWSACYHDEMDGKLDSWKILEMRASS